jgi:ubiquinone/menaquinone biosynthesis C-methylase UbiE
MTPYSKKKIQNTYSKVTWIYNVWSFLTESKAHNQALQFGAIKNKESILEVAVGTGSFFEKILQLNPSGKNIGLDISDSMLKIARKRLKNYKNFRLISADAARIPFKANSFDLLINNYMLDLLPDQDHVPILKEFKRVLKPNGRLVVTTMAKARNWYSRPWHAIAKTPLLTGCKPFDLRNKIIKSGFVIKKSKYITQNTFPSLVIYAKLEFL